METEKNNQDKKELKIDFEGLGEAFDNVLLVVLVVIVSFMAFFG